MIKMECRVKGVIYKMRSWNAFCVLMGMIQQKSSHWRHRGDRWCNSRKKRQEGGGEQDGREVGGHGVHLSPRIHQEYTFRHSSACRTPAGSGKEDLTSRKYTEQLKAQWDGVTGGNNWSVSGSGPALGRCGNWSRDPIPASGQLSESEEKRLRLRVRQLICGSLTGRRIR